jgi:hypothetical protein
MATSLVRLGFAWAAAMSINVSLSTEGYGMDSPKEVSPSVNMSAYARPPNADHSRSFAFKPGEAIFCMVDWSVFELMRKLRKRVNFNISTKSFGIHFNCQLDYIYKPTNGLIAAVL